MTGSLQVVLLGTGSPIPDPQRAGPATLVRAGGVDLLVDCGRGALMRLAAAGASPATLGAVLLTHHHSDHITDLNDMITTRWVMSMAPNPLPIMGPTGTGELVDRTMAMLEADIGYRLAHHGDLTEPPAVKVIQGNDGVIYHFDGIHLVLAPTDHAPVHPSIGWRIEVGDRVAVIAGDTRPGPILDQLCAGADVYVQTVVRPDLLQAIPVPRLHDVIGYHSSVREAAETATRAGVRTLVLTHMVPTVAPGQEQDWIDQATEAFDGEVVLGTDLAVIDA